jgi:hypothetical protein
MPNTPKAIAMLIREKVRNRVVIQFKIINVFSVPIKRDDDITRNCPNTEIGTKKKRNFVHMYSLGVTGDVLVIHM